MESLNKADESGAKVKEAKIAAENATTGYVTDLAEGVKAHSYSPEAAQIAISHAKDIFSTNPSMMQQIGTDRAGDSRESDAGSGPRID